MSEVLSLLLGQSAPGNSYLATEKTSEPKV